MKQSRTRPRCLYSFCTRVRTGSPSNVSRLFCLLIHLWYYVMSFTPLSLDIDPYVSSTGTRFDFPTHSEPTELKSSHPSSIRLHPVNFLTVLYSSPSTPGPVSPKLLGIGRTLPLSDVGPKCTTVYLVPL